MDPVRRERHEVPPLTPTGRALVVYFALYRSSVGLSPATNAILVHQNPATPSLQLFIAPPPREVSALVTPPIACGFASTLLHPTNGVTWSALKTF